MNSSFGVDHIRSPKVSGPVTLADLTRPEGIQVLFQWLDHENVIGIFLAPPRGTSSRARSIPLTRGRKRMRNGAPKPLRSDRFANGLLHLSFLERMKVSKENRLYHLTVQLCKVAMSRGMLVVVENPQYSFMWKTSFWLEIASLLNYVIFHSCQFGSRKQKKTMLAHNHPAFCMLAKRCPGGSASHSHAKWGVHQNKFVTAEETAYPIQLAAEIAYCFASALVEAGAILPPDTMFEVSGISPDLLQAIRAQTGLLPKPSKLPPLIPEYAQVVTVAGPANSLPPDSTRRLEANFVLPSDVSTPVPLLPAQSKLLKSYSTLLGLKAGGDDGCSLEGLSFKSNMISQKWGIPWEPIQFMQKANEVGHPCSLSSLVPDQLKACVQAYCNVSVATRCKMRVAKLKHWVQCASELKEKERQLKEGMPETVRTVLSGKKILLWEKLLAEAGYPDMAIVDEFKSGTMLVGKTPKCGLWPEKFSPASSTLDDLAAQAKNGRYTLLNQMRQRGDPIVEKSVWDQTLAEVKKGFMTGPFEPETIDCSIPLSRRFGVVQGPKIRCVDDYTRSGINSTVQTEESPRPHTLDVLAGLISELMRVAPKQYHWVIRSFDLKDAYRQVAVHPDSIRYSHIIVLNPCDGKPYVFRMTALPFGSMKSVHVFLRIAASLWYIAVHHLRILTTGYFDDFVALCQEPEKSNVTSSFEAMLDLLGWRFARDGAKAPPFSESVTALGVRIDVSELHNGKVVVDNTETRKSDIAAQLNSILDAQKLPPHDALKLRGRMQFTSGQLYGRLVNACLALVTNHAYSNVSHVISKETSKALEFFRDRLLSATPRVLTNMSLDCWCVFTDASYERTDTMQKAGFGGVLVNPMGRPVEFFSFEMSPCQLDLINPKNKKTCIFECEFFAVLCALTMWSKYMFASQAVAYIDNNSVRDALISCHTPNRVARLILERCLTLEDARQIRMWYNRISTASNIADWPSRGECTKLLDLSCKQISVDVSSIIGCLRS